MDRFLGRSVEFSASTDDLLDVNRLSLDIVGLLVIRSISDHFPVYLKNAMRT